MTVISNSRFKHKSGRNQNTYTEMERNAYKNVTGRMIYINTANEKMT